MTDRISGTYSKKYFFNNYFNNLDSLGTIEWE